VFLAHGGEVLVTKMHAVRISDLAQVMIEELAPRQGRDPRAVAVQVIGRKPGEKMYEDLLSDEETRRTVELPRYYVVTPAFRSVYRAIDYTYPDVVSDDVAQPYNSANQPLLGKEELRAYLLAHHLLD